MNVMLLDAGECNERGVVTVSDARAMHLLRTLKVTPGHPIRVGVINGPLGVATVRETSPTHVTLECSFDMEMPPRPRVDLLLALPRPKVMRRLWAQLAALGVGQIILTNAARVERNYFDAHVLSEACYRPLLLEGLQQARDTRLPRVSIHRQFRVLVEDHLDELFDEGVRVVADAAASISLAHALRTTAADRVLLAIGPEGGWNAFELRLLESHRFHAVNAGRRTLRVDTACTALLAIVHSLVND